MNVTKTMAEEIANKMVQPMVDNYKKKKEILRQYVETIVLGQIPVDVQKAYKKHRDFFQGCSSVTLANGSALISYCDVNYDKVPYNNNSNVYTCTNEQFDFVSKLKKDLKDIKDEKYLTNKSIVETLLSLRTTKRVIEQFPSAAEFVKQYDEKQVTTLSLPISDIDNVLKKYKTK